MNPAPTASIPTAPSLDALSAVDGRLYWIEGRPEGDVLVQWGDGRSRDVLPPTVHLASAVHEYGGGAYLVHGGEVWFVHAEDQGIWRTVCGELSQVTGPPREGQDRHADLEISADGLLVCVRERHRKRVMNQLVSMPADGSADARVIGTCWDFYSSPRMNLDGSRLAWLTWNAPLMPWDGCWLWVADIQGDGTLGPETPVAGGPEESVCQPRWSPDGVLHFLSDRTGWWNLYRWGTDRPEPVITIDAELGPAPWEFGYATYQFLRDNRIAVIVQRGCQSWLNVWHGDSRPPEQLPLPYSSIKPYLAVDGDQLAIIGADLTHDPSVILVDPTTARTRKLTPSRSFPSAIETTPPEPIRFPTRTDASAYGVLYQPGNRIATPKPPLLVRVHPGPTANAKLQVDPWVTFFTAHGFAVLDVDYRGSTGYGRAYRNALRGQWGVLDVADCVDAVHYLVAAGIVDHERVAICGSSAGGYTALRAVATTNTFAAAMVRHAIIDPALWRQSAPKFQAHHVEFLIAPPTDSDTFDDRSVLRHAHAVTAPVLIIHGAQDTVASISQAHSLASSLGAKANLLIFPDEGHGLRDPDHARQAMNAELDHLERNFGL